MLPSVIVQGDYKNASFIFTMAINGRGLDLCLEFPLGLIYVFALVVSGLNLAWYG